MKVYGLIVFVAALGLALGLPASRNAEQTTQKEVDKEVDFVPLEGKNSGVFPPGGVIDVDAGSFFGDNPFGRIPFSSTFNSLEATLTRMRQLMNQLLGRVPTDPNGLPDFPELHIPSFGDVDLSKGNTTSVTKIINGHKVTINDTEYKSEEGNGSSYFKVHVVEVHPDEVDTDTKKEAPVSPPKGEPESESSEEPLNNEIPKIKDNEGSKLDENIETLDEIDVIPPQQFVKQQWNKVPDVENFEDNRIDSAPSKPYDLSRDTYVNQLLADSGAKTNPDAEVFEAIEGRAPSVQYYPEVRATPVRVASNYYPNNYYEQPRYQQIQPSYYAPPPMVPLNDPYYNRYQPEQIMIVPLDVAPQSSYLVPPVHVTSSTTQGVTSNSQSTFSKTASEKMAPSTT